MSAEVREAAEQLAARMIRAALDNATTPDLERIAEQTALTPREVSALRDRMLSGKRHHQTPRPGTVPPSPAGPRLTVVTDPEPWRAAGRDHPDAAVRKLHARATAAVVALEAALADYARTAAKRAERDQLRARLAELDAELKPRKPAGQWSCPPCSKSFTSSQGLALHRTRMHAGGPMQPAG